MLFCVTVLMSFTSTWVPILDNAQCRLNSWQFPLVTLMYSSAAVCLRHGSVHQIHNDGSSLLELHHFSSPNPPSELCMPCIHTFSPLHQSSCGNLVVLSGPLPCEMWSKITSASRGSFYCNTLQVVIRMQVLKQKFLILGKWLVDDRSITIFHCTEGCC